MEPEDFIIERLILRIGNTINNRRIADLKDWNLTPAQSETILFYDSNPGSSIRKLADHLRVTHQAARKLVDKLRSKGILESYLSEDDKRYTRIYLTDSGKSLCKSLKKSGATTGQDILTGFSEKEKTALLKYMQRIEKNVEKA